MAIPKNDPALWTDEGIAQAITEATDEKGAVVEWGWVLLGSVYRPASREPDTMMPLPAVKDRPDCVELWGTVTVNEADVIEYLQADAEAHLPPETRYELREKHPTNYGRTYGMCWYRNAAIDARKEWGAVPMTPRLMVGYFLVGEYTTPKR